MHTAQTLLTAARDVLTSTVDLAGDIGPTVLANLNPPRRPRVCMRRVKPPVTLWHKHPPGKPRTCLRVTSLTSTRTTINRTTRHTTNHP